MTQGSESQKNASAIGLPGAIRALLFDLDGVITRTSVIHAAAWKTTLDELLEHHPLADGVPQPEFDPEHDYARYVDGLPRYDGVRSFLGSRRIELPEGDPDDAPGYFTVCAIGNRKNELVFELIERDGVETYAGTIEYLDAVAAAGMPCAVVSSSKNCRMVLESCGLLDRFQFVMDGVVAAQRGIAGKPAPDTFLAAGEELEAPAAACAVFEDALAGVAAGRAGGFGHVVGVNRIDQREELLVSGADVVVDDLAELIAR